MNRITALFLFFILVGGFLLFKFLVPGIKSANSTLAQKRVEINSKKEKIEILKSLKRDYETNKSNIDLISLAMPVGEDLPNIILALQGLGADVGVSISTIHPFSTPDQSSGKLAISFDGQASFPKILELLQATERNLRPLELESLTISSQEEVLSANFSINALYQPKTAPAKTPSPEAMPSAGEELKELKE